MNREHFRPLKRTADGLEIESLGTTIPEGTVLRVRRSSTTGAEELACVVRGEDGQGWTVVTDGGEELSVDEVTAMVVAVQEDGALQ